MKIVLGILEERIRAAMDIVSGLENCAAIVKPSTDPKFGDYQANGVMGLAKKLKTNPRKFAEEVVKNLDLSDICEPPEVAGPGFINLRLKPEYLADRLLEINKHIANLGIDEAAVPKTIVVDFSSPNIAKQMHVGHLRSTIIGDCICRTLEFLGHKIIRQNHIGDWGTQFGMLAWHLDYKKFETDEFLRKKGLARQKAFSASDLIPDMEKFYREAKKLFDNDSNFADKSREYVVKLHSGDKHVLFDWEMIVNASLTEYRKIYNILKTTLENEHVRGESFYKDMLADVVAELREKGLAVESEGAVCVFPEGFTNKEGEPLPFIIQKSDGAYLYATTDLAALRYRVNELKADKIVYVTDSRQKLHFDMLFAVAKKAGWVGDDIELSHVMFGTVLGDDGTPLKTRSGENVKLKELLDEAVERAKSVVEEKNSELSSQEKEQIAKAVGIGAVKYADYSNNRTSDYVFSFDKMLAMDGNTAPYMQYAYARIKSIERKAQGKDVDIEEELAGLDALNLSEPAELDLAKYLIRYGEALQAAVADYRPNYLTTYLYELAQKFSAFYTNCPVLKAEPDKRPTRLLLCDLTAKTIRHGLSELLGIEVVEQM
ncbi:MAG: arginine--tRNA ligase [Planctomycetes bacterium]|nr:arginine--tRNA ligase [Planctomycetota bacterium]